MLINYGSITIVMKFYRQDKDILSHFGKALLFDVDANIGPDR